MELVSVVMPVFNGERYLEATLASVFAQTYPEIELIVVDDGSTDRSLEILDALGDRVVVVRQQNRGPAAARNLGVQKAKGKWIAFLDADDIWEPEKIQRQLAQCGGFSWSYTDSVFMGGVNDGRRDSEFTPKFQGMVVEKLICSNFISTSTVMVLRQALLDAGGFDESLRSIQDWELWVRLAGRCEVGYLDEPMMRYRVHSASTSRGTRNTLPNHLKVIDKMFAPGSVGASLRHLMPRAKAKSYSICAQIAEEEGDYSYALHCAMQALRHQPSQWLRWELAAKTAVKFLLSSLGVKGFARAPKSLNQSSRS